MAHTRAHALLATFLAIGATACTGTIDGVGPADGATSSPDAAAARDAPGTADAPGPAVRTVFIILLENHNWSAIAGSASAPFINQMLLPNAAYATKYYNPPGVHPSLPNYLWLEAGDDFGIADDSGPLTNHQATTMHLARLLDDAGISWRSYQEDISGTVCPLTSVRNYAPKHNPFVYFDDITGGHAANDPGCIAHNRPFSELHDDLLNGRVARYNFITPNLCNDMHDSCAPLSNSILQGDTFLANVVPDIMSSPAYQNGGALFITWDEGAPGDGPIGMIVVSPAGKGGGYHGAHAYTHSSTLRTLQEIFGVRPFLGDAANAEDLSDLFARFP
jgi:phospholipase C